MLSSVGVVFVVSGIALASVGIAVSGAVAATAGVLRAVWWAKVCATSQLRDDGEHLVWMYRGESRAEVAWSDLRHVLFQRWARQLIWAIGPNSGGPFPYVLIDARSERPSGFRHFAEILIIHKAELQAADKALADACRRHGVTYHGVDSGW